ncbi:unnamed protein product [Symbiodinium natans]|uniref:Uncharacterized protein n=1 Tax=Symbiodinium natans TaxID=878477 RepID=A0A812NU39_9DINO|nr:unnamed protein product [Symbiodinium natans]
MAGPHEAHLSHSQIPRLIQCFLHGSRNSPLRLIVVLHRCWQLFNVVARYVYSIIHSLQCGSYPWSNTFYSRFRRYVSLWTSHSGKAMTRALAFSLLHSKVYLSWASDVTSGERSDDVIQTGLQSSSIPVSFASATIEVLSSLQPASGPKDLTVTEAKQLLPSKPFGNPPFAFQDGGGIGSCPDWSCPPPGTPNVLLDLRQSWMSFLLRIKLPLRLRDFVRSGGEASLFTYEEIAELRGRFQLWARRNGGIAEVNWQVDDGQPYCLRALQTLSSLIMDKDTSLFPCLIEGVPTGFDKNIPKSNVFAPRESDSTIDAELLLCGGNWSSAEANPELLRQLVAKEVEAGYLVPVSLEEARQRWPNRLAVGKLSIVSSDRLVVDNSICNTNALCDINETYTLPLLGSVRACFPLRGLPCELAACTIDVKSAHKTMRVKHADQGLLGVQCDGQHYFYRVCPFGACFSALWWARLGSFFVRVLHLSIFVRHSLMLYVDGFFVTQDASTLYGLAGVRLKLHLHVQKLLADPKNVRKRDLHKVAGLIQWVLGAFPLLRPWVGVLYKDIHCPPATNHSLDPHYFKEVFDCIDERMRFIRSPTGTAIPVGAKLLEVRHLPIRQKKDLLKVVLSCKRVWLRVADPAQVKRKLSANSVAFLQFWLHWCKLPTLLRPLQFPARTTIVAAAGSSGRHGIRNQVCYRWLCQTFDSHDLVQRMFPTGGFCFCRD